MHTTNNERADYEAAIRTCDECGCEILPGQQANPSHMAEAFCSTCWPAVDAAPEPADVGATVRIPAQTMSSLVFGGAA